MFYDAPNKCIQITFSEIAKGYILSYEQLSKKIYHKKLASLSDKEIFIIKRTLPLRIYYEHISSNSLNGVLVHSEGRP